MPTTEYCVYNETRENFLIPRITVIDTRSEPLRAVKVLIEGLAPDADAGLWLNPLKNLPTVPRLSAYDLVYLDPEGRVVHSVELVPDEEAPRFDGAASALVLPIHSFAASHTHPGDRVILRAAEDQSAEPLPVPPPSESLQLAPQPTPSNAPEELAPASPEPVFTAIQQMQPLAWPLPTLQPQDPPVEPKTVSAPKPQSRFDLLRSIVRLRIRVQISISTAAPSAPNSAQSPAESPILSLDLSPSAPAIAPSASQSETSLASATHSAASYWSSWSTLQSKMRRAYAALSRRAVAFATATVPHFFKHVIPARAAQLRSALSSICSSWKAGYLRWADAFMFRPANTSRRIVFRLRIPRRFRLSRPKLS